MTRPLKGQLRHLRGWNPLANQSHKQPSTPRFAEASGVVAKTISWLVGNISTIFVTQLQLFKDRREWKIYIFAAWLRKL